MTSSTLNQRDVNLDDNNRFICGTKIVKIFNGIPFRENVQYYDEVNNWFCIIHIWMEINSI